MCAGADVLIKGENGVDQFRYPSYVQHIMGDIFSLGFGPFRCLLSTNLTVGHTYSRREWAFVTRTSRLERVSKFTLPYFKQHIPPSHP